MNIKCGGGIYEWRYHPETEHLTCRTFPCDIDFAPSASQDEIKALFDKVVELREKLDRCHDILLNTCDGRFLDEHNLLEDARDL